LDYFSKAVKRSTFSSAPQIESTQHGRRVVTQSGELAIGAIPHSSIWPKLSERLSAAES
jgi:hypothetical protein